MKDRDFITALQERVLICDGAMGTQLYGRGVFINRSFDEMCIREPSMVEQVHQEYLAAGAEILTSNTYGANRLRLAGYGLESQVEAINAAGIKLARQVAGNMAWVAGSMGPSGRELQPVGMISPDDAYAAFREQAAALANAGADVIFLETFTSLRELELAFRAVRSVCQLPIIPFSCYLFDTNGLFVGDRPEDVAQTVQSWGAVALGTNCGYGPAAALEVVERLAHSTSLKVAANPNAGLPQQVEGRTIYLATPEYMGEFARRLVQKGASMVGGCCGTTPAQIREIKNYVKSITPSRTTVVITPPEERPAAVEPKPTGERTRFGCGLGKRFMISVELDPPHGLDPRKAIEGARFLHIHGIDVVNIADGPRAIARMSPMSLATLIKHEVGMEAIIHYCCRDRNLLGMQMDLIGANALGLRNVLAITGDPPKMGNYPNATGVFDVDAIGLIHLIQQLNRGLDLAGQPLGGGTELVVGAGCNPGAVDLDIEVARYGRKLEAGAEYFFSQPVYDPELLQTFLKRVSVFPKKVPFFVGILPLASHKNAEFLHNEVPGMQIPLEIRERMRMAGSRDAQRQEGIRVARETLKEAKSLAGVDGVYIFPPFGRYEAVLDVIDVL
ncbi:MAG: bifunctional homocysteine S-methyltransferase/methylenetetrahydrofolate reductase [Myxococcota bacterium]